MTSFSEAVVNMRFVVTTTKQQRFQLKQLLKSALEDQTLEFEKIPADGIQEI